MNNWSVYMIVCTDDSLYTGICVDVKKRFLKHQAKLGAKYFRSHTPSRVVYVENGHDRSSATKREIAIKKLKRTDKIKLIDSISNQVGEGCN